MKTKAIIFDCFGVLAEDGWTPFKRKYLAHDPELLRKAASLGRQSDLGNRDREKTTEAVARIAGVSTSELRTALTRRVPNEELFDFIRTNLKPKYKIGMMSNASYDVNSELFSKDHQQLFDAYVLSYESGLVKPDPQMYRLIAQRLGEDIADCLFIDDQERYVIAAREAGGQGIWYQDFEQFKGELKAFIG